MKVCSENDVGPWVKNSTAAPGAVPEKKLPRCGCALPDRSGEVSFREANSAGKDARLLFTKAL
jgi:hypothetical protein